MPKKSAKVAGWIRFTFVDHRENAFVELGGAGWPARTTLMARWRALPVLDETRTRFVADRLSADGCTILDTQFTAAEAIEDRLGEPIAALIARGRAELDQRCAHMKRRLANQNAKLEQTTRTLQ